MFIIVLAGGGGTRLWPLSRQEFPKQFLNFGDHESLLQKTVSRFVRSKFAQKVVVSTNPQYKSLVEQQLRKMKDGSQSHLLVEPCRKNTAPAIALSVKYLESFLHASLDDIVLVLPSDHLIESESIFMRYLEESEKVAKESGKIVTFGIRPTKPETGYGYIQIGSSYNFLTYEIARFAEKPDLARAQEYILNSEYYWNSGMFLFSVQTFWEELQTHSPNIRNLMSGTYDEAIANFEQLPDISMDYAVMEKSHKTLVCPLPVSWTDVGCWDSVYDVMQKDENQNVIIGDVIDIDTKNSLIIGGKRLVSTIGLQDVLIVATDDALFITKRGESQRVKNLVQKLVHMGRKESEGHAIQNLPWGIFHSLYASKEYCIDTAQILPHHHFSYHAKAGGKSIAIVLLGTIQNGASSIIPFQPMHLQSQSTYEFTNTSSNLSILMLITIYPPNF